jgi:hypothetical protein
MTGPNQHYIPQFLQRGFGVRWAGKTKDIWQYRKGHPATLESIERIGAEAHFYSSPSDSETAELDAKITRLERPLARQVKTLSLLKSGSAVDAKIAFDVLFHLVPRTRHIRSTFSDAFASIIDGALTLFSDPATLMHLAGLDQTVMNEKFRKELGSKLLEDPRSQQFGYSAPLFEKLAFQMAKEGFASGQFPQLQPLLSEMALMLGRHAYVLRRADTFPHRTDTRIGNRCVHRTRQLPLARSQEVSSEARLGEGSRNVFS